MPLTKNQSTILLVLFVAIFVIGIGVGFVAGNTYTIKQIDSVSDSKDNKIQIGGNIYSVSKVNTNSTYIDIDNTENTNPWK